MAAVYDAYEPRLHEVLAHGFIVPSSGARVPALTSPDDRADVIQLTMMRGLADKVRQAYDAELDFWPLLRTIARNEMVSRHRKYGREIPSSGHYALEEAGTLSACPVSASLVFSVRAKSGRAAGFVSAYAEPGSGGERVFYLSKEDGSARLAAEAEGGRGSERAVRIGSAQRAGRYRVHVFFAKRALERREMVAGTPVTDVTASARVEVVIVE